MESNDKIKWQCFRPNEQQVKILNQQLDDCFLREENIDLFFNSDMVNSLLKTSGGDTEGLILLEGSYSMID